MIRSSLVSFRSPHGQLYLPRLVGYQELISAAQFRAEDHLLSLDDTVDMWKDLSDDLMNPRSVGFLSIYRCSTVINTGIAYGPTAVTIETTDSHPSAPPGQWEEVAEATIPRGDSDEFYASTLGGDGASELVVAKPRGRVIRIRVWATGRNTHYDLVVDEVTESYWIQLWGEDAPRPDYVSVLDPPGEPAPPLSPEAAAAKDDARARLLAKVKSAGQESPAKRKPGSTSRS